MSRIFLNIFNLFCEAAAASQGLFDKGTILLLSMAQSAVITGTRSGVRQQADSKLLLAFWLLKKKKECLSYPDRGC